MPKLEYTVDAKGSIVLPTGAPFDGEPVLVKLAAGWCSAWWSEGRVVWGQDGVEAEGFQWICMDDQFQAELDDVSWWLPLPEYAYARLRTAQAVGSIGGNARAAKLSPERRSEIAKLGAAARWSKEEKK